MKLKLAISALFLVSISFVGCGDDTGHKKVSHSVPTPAPVQEVAPAPMQEPVSAPVQEAAPTSVAKADGASLFKKCAGCHGVNAEKSALGKSKVIAGWESAKIVKALHGYKDGSYGGAMKGLMKGQVATLNDSEIQALSEYISTKK